MKTDKLSGIFAPITTPFHQDGSINQEGLAGNVRKYASTGLKGFLALGSNGENKSLTSEEKLLVLKTIIQSKGTDQVVIAGCIFESTRETVNMAQRMEELKPDFISVLPPSYFKKQMTDDALCQYFTDVADSVETPCVLYNAPQFAGGVSLSIELLRRLKTHKNIYGIKDSSSGNIDSILFEAREDLNVLAGSVNNYMTGMLLGATGGVLSLANSFPDICVAFHQAVVSKDYENAIAINDRVLQINKVISGSGGVAAVKYAMDQNGFYGGLPRLPLLPLKEKEKLNILNRLKSNDFIK